jgi:phospholipid N-methyltransferase
MLTQTLQNRLPVPTVQTTPVASSAIAQITYDSGREILEVGFRDGSVHQYSSVPLRVHQDFLQAVSKGAHFNRFIRDHFPGHLIRGRPSLD